MSQCRVDSIAGAGRLTSAKSTSTSSCVILGLIFSHCRPTARSLSGASKLTRKSVDVSLGGPGSRQRRLILYCLWMTQEVPLGALHPRQICLTSQSSHHKQGTVSMWLSACHRGFSSIQPSLRRTARTCSSNPAPCHWSNSLGQQERPVQCWLQSASFPGCCAPGPDQQCQACCALAAESGAGERSV